MVGNCRQSSDHNSLAVVHSHRGLTYAKLYDGNIVIICTSHMVGRSSAYLVRTGGEGPKFFDLCIHALWMAPKGTSSKPFKYKHMLNSLPLIHKSHRGTSRNEICMPLWQYVVGFLKIILVPLIPNWSMLPIFLKLKFHHKNLSKVYNYYPVYSDLIQTGYFTYLESNINVSCLKKICV